MGHNTCKSMGRVLCVVRRQGYPLDIRQICNIDPMRVWNPSKKNFISANVVTICVRYVTVLCYRTTYSR